MKPKRGRREKLPVSITRYIPTLVVRLALKLVQSSAAGFADMDLTIPKWRVLLALAEFDKIKFGELVKLTRIEAPTLSRTLGAMQDAKLVRRDRSTKDARSVTISLTPYGRKLFASTLPWAKEVERNLVRGLSKNDVDRFRAAIAAMHRNMDATGAKD